jgi:flagellar biosynthesis/type III secretory pathway M-ring protein FliF/YscJ
MAIDKESSGVPEVDLGRRTTKVNLAIIVAAIVFFIITFTVVMNYAKRSEPEKNRPNPPTQNQ